MSKIKLGKPQYPYFWPQANQGHHKQMCISCVLQMYTDKLEQGQVGTETKLLFHLSG